MSLQIICVNKKIFNSLPYNTSSKRRIKFMSGDDDFLVALPFLKCLCFLTLNLAWLVIGCVLYNAGTSQYSGVIEHETGEWGKAPIVDFAAVSEPTCPDGFEMVTGTFPGTRTFCMSSSSNFFEKPWIGAGFGVGACRKRSRGTTIYGLGPRSLSQFDSNYFCIKRDKDLNYHKLS